MNERRRLLAEGEELWNGGIAQYVASHSLVAPDGTVMLGVRLVSSSEIADGEPEFHGREVRVSKKDAERLNLYLKVRAWRQRQAPPVP